MVGFIEDPSGVEALRLDLDRAIQERLLRPTPENLRAERAAQEALDAYAAKAGQETAGSWRGFGSF